MEKWIEEMAFRLLEVIIPEQLLNDVGELLEEQGITDFWQTCGCEDSIVLKIVLPFEKTETLIDALESRFKNIESFRLVLYPLEAIYPGLQEKEKEPGAVTADDSQKVPLRVSRQELSWCRASGR